MKGHPTAELEIPDITDGYNNNMGYVDGFDHLTAMNAGLRRVKRGVWQALEHWLLCTVLVNIYIIAQVWLRESERVKLRSQVEWRLRIVEGLLEAVKIALKDSLVYLKSTISYRKRAYPDTDLDKYMPVKGKKRRCVYCKGMRPGDRPLK